jgi:aspartate aminotransferase
MPDAITTSGPPKVRPAVAALPASKVREIANAGFGRSDILRFWFGEDQAPTPDHIKSAAIAAIGADETYYTHNNGRAALRTAIGGYLTDLHGAPFPMERVCVTSSGVSALNIAMQALLEPGDRVVVVTPVWPNVTAIPAVLGAKVVRAPLRAHGGRWRLDLDQLLGAITPGTRLVIINSPGNPTGWVLADDERLPILQRCRQVGAWLLADDVYERLIFDDGRRSAPSFLAIADPEDRVIGANSFSKAWRMTGWRLGWLVTPAELESDIGKLIEFNTSCAPDFIQAAGIAAIHEGEPHVAAQRLQLKASADRLIDQLSALEGVEAPRPDGAMYAFFRVAGEEDSVGLARRLVAEAGLGLAPGAAFGPEGEGWLRWCVAAAPDLIDAGVQRLATWLGR